MKRRSHWIPLAILAAVTIAGALLSPGAARADVPGPITTRVDNLISVAGGTTGLYVKEVGGSVIAAKNETFAFEPASSIKVLLHLYAHTQVQAGNATLADPVTLYAPPPPADGSCPVNSTNLGTES